MNKLLLRLLPVFLSLLLFSCKTQKINYKLTLDPIQLRIDADCEKNDIRALVDDCKKYPSYAPKIREYILKRNYSENELNRLLRVVADDSILLAGCQSKLILNHLDSNSIVSLEQDYTRFSLYTFMVRDYLVNKVDYSHSDYKTLCVYRDEMKNDSILYRALFRNVLLYENSILSSMENRYISDVVLFYRKHEEYQTFMNPVFEKTLTENIGNYGYQKLKGLRSSYLETSFKPIVEKEYNKQRKALEPRVKNSIAKELKYEKETANLLRQYLSDTLNSYITNAYADILIELSKTKFPKNKTKIDHLFSDILKKHYSEDALNRIINNTISSYPDYVNRSRMSFLQHVNGSSLPYYCLINETSVRSNVLNAKKINMAPLYDIADMQNQSDGLGTLLDVAGYIPVVGFFANAASAIHTYNKASDNAEATAKYLKTFSKSLLPALKGPKDSKLDSIFRDYSASEESFKKYVYENY